MSLKKAANAAKYPSDRTVVCFYCKKSVKQKHSAEHARDFCTVAKGIPWREQAEKGQSVIMGFFKKKSLTEHVSEVSASILGNKRKREEIEREQNALDFAPPMKRQRPSDNNDRSLLKQVLDFFAQFIPDFRRDARRFKEETDKLHKLANRTVKLLEKFENKAASNCENMLKERQSFDNFLESRGKEGLLVSRSENK